MAFEGLVRPGRCPRAGKQKKPKIVYEDDGEPDSGATRTALRAARAGAKSPAASLSFWIGVTAPNVVSWFTTGESVPASGAAAWA